MNHLIRTSGWLALFFYICQIHCKDLDIDVLHTNVTERYFNFLFSLCVEGNGPAGVVEVIRWLPVSYSMTLYRIYSLEPH